MYKYANVEEKNDKRHDGAAAKRNFNEENAKTPLAAAAVDGFFFAALKLRNVLVNTVMICAVDELLNYD